MSQQPQPLPHPEEWDITIPELAMLIADVRGGKQGQTRHKRIMDRFFVTNETASYWLSLVNEYNRQRGAA